MRLLAGRASIFLTFAARSTIIYLGKDQGSCEWLRHTHATFGQCERLANVLSTYIRKSFTTITHKVSFWRLKWSQLLRKNVSQNKAKMRDVLGKMREIHQNAGFPARLRMVDTYEMTLSLVSFGRWSLTPGTLLLETIRASDCGRPRRVFAQTRGRPRQVILYHKTISGANMHNFMVNYLKNKGIFCLTLNGLLDLDTSRSCHELNR